MSLYRQTAGKYWLRRRSNSIIRDVITASFFLGSTILVSGMFVYLFSIIYSMPWLETKKVVIRGINELTEQEVMDVAQVKKGVNILAVNTREIERRVKMIPWVKEVHVGREYPSRIVIDIKERVAVAMLKRGEDIYLLDKEANPFKKLSTRDDVDLPILTGFSGDGSLRSQLLAKALALIDYLKSNPGAASLESISEIHGDERLGLTLFTTTGMCLVLGFNDYEAKLKNVPLVLADLERKNMRTAFLRIDLSDPVKVTVQPRQVPAPQKSRSPEGEVKI
ncbi:MAG: FtsQ-type POTRA domain-containing protein [Syntrophales bacterium]|nr:FtsQ-type POTRA domain-containing protein [Syntrophales bacterium]